MPLSKYAVYDSKKSDLSKNNKQIDLWANDGLELY